MAWKPVATMALALFLLDGTAAQALTVCAKRDRRTDEVKDGAKLRLRETCKDKEIAVDATALGMVEPPKVRSLPIESATPLSGAIYELNGGADLSGMALANASFPRFAVGFTLPSDYIPGDDVSVRIVWGNSAFGATSCGFVVWANGVSVFRDLAPPLYPDATFPNGSDLVTLNAPSVPQQIRETTLTIPGELGGIPSFLPGDAFSVLIARRPDDLPDTCTGKIFVLGAEMSYAPIP